MEPRHLTSRERFLAMAGALLFSAGGAVAGEVQIAPFAGLQYGGGFNSTISGQNVSIGGGFAYGGTVDVGVSENWRVELLYSRQETELDGGSTSPRVDLGVERYMVGIQEEKGEGRSRFFGNFLLGATRFAPGLDGYDADMRFTVGVGLGVKTWFAKGLGLRLEARGFLVIVESGGGVLCSSGTCLFSYSASGLWQGDISAALALRF